MIPTIEWLDDVQKIKMVDQTKLPGKLEYLELSTYEEAAETIINMNVRGAPAIGVTAAMGMALAGIQFHELPIGEFLQRMELARIHLLNTRPTAVNLFWALERIKKVIEGDVSPVHEISAKIVQEAKTMWQEDIDINRQIGKHGADILEEGDTVLTHCNAGSLATVLYGTALAPVRWAFFEQHKKIDVIADETRPRLQGACLTAWELQYDGIPVKVETDGSAGLMMRQGKINKIIVGADRIVKDTVFNKIGTYMVAIAANYHHIPFYVAAPQSTLSLHESEGDVTIEQRNGQFEVGEIMGRLNSPIVPAGVECINFAFDATPMELVTGIITEDGIFSPSELLQFYQS